MFLSLGDLHNPRIKPRSPALQVDFLWLNTIYMSKDQYSSVQLPSHVRLFATPWTAARQASLSITNSQICSKACPLSQWCHPTILSSVIPFSSRLQSFPASGYFQMSQFFVSGGQSIGVSSFSISPSNEYSGLISFRIDWLDLLAVQGSLKSLLQYHSSKAMILQRSAFFIVQLSHPYMTTGKTKALTRWTFADKVMSLLFNMLSRLVIGFLPRSKCLNFMAAVTICSDFGAPPQNKVCHCFHCFPIYLQWSEGTRCHDLSFLNVDFQASFFTLLFHFHQEAL